MKEKIMMYAIDQLRRRKQTNAKMTDKKVEGLIKEQPEELESLLEDQLYGHKSFPQKDLKSHLK